MKTLSIVLASIFLFSGIAIAEDNRHDRNDRQSSEVERDRHDVNRNNQRPAVTSGDFMASIPPQAVSVDSLVGSNVISRSDNETIGEVEDVVIDRNGNLVGVIVSVGGFLGIGDKDVALDWDHVDLAPGDENGLFDRHDQVPDRPAAQNPLNGQSMAGDGQRHETHHRNWDPDDYVLIVNVSQDTLEDAPEFDWEGWDHF